MSTVATIESLWRYPVKSMRGQQLATAFAGFSGIYGDRIAAIHDTAAPEGFPYLTAREREHMLLFTPTFPDPERSTHPPNQAQAEAMGGITPVYPSLEDLDLHIHTPDGQTLALSDPALLALLADGLRDRHHLTLLRSQRAFTDCSPISLFSIQTARQLGEELDTPIDKLRFRANIYLDLTSAAGSTSSAGFGEDRFVGHKLRIGDKVVLSVLDRDPRCKIITLDPDTSAPNPEVIKKVAHAHEGRAGIYAAVLVEGTIRPGDPVTLLT